MALPPLNAKILERIDIAPSLMTLRIEPDGWKIPKFKAGQYCAIGLPPSSERSSEANPEKNTAPDHKLVNRAYSLSSASNQTNYLEIYVTMVPDGSLTPRLFNLKKGDALWVSPKIVGHFTAETLPENVYTVLISTGTGLAPYISMLRSDLINNKRPGIAIFHGVRQSWDLGYSKELLNWQKTVPGFLYLPTISRPQNEKEPWSGHTGYVQSLWDKRICEAAWKTKLTPKNTHLFLCGAPNMIDEMLEQLQKEGYQEHTSRTPGQIHIERYW